MPCMIPIGVAHLFNGRLRSAGHWDRMTPLLAPRETPNVKQLHLMKRSPEGRHSPCDAKVSAVSQGRPGRVKLGPMDRRPPIP
jgi:hypothetical protein